MRDHSIETETSLEAATNCWSNAEQQVFNMLPQLQGYRDLIGAADVAEATNATYFEEPPAPDNSAAYEVSDGSEVDYDRLNGFGVVAGPIEEPYELTLHDDRSYRASGVVVVRVERMMLDYAERDNMYHGNERRWFINRLGDLMQEMYDYRRLNGGPNIKRISVDYGPLRSDESAVATEGRWQSGMLSIFWNMIE